MPYDKVFEGENTLDYLTRRMNEMKINICKMQLDPTSCDYVIRNIGCRCCHRGCTRQNCNYRCKNYPEKCEILEECETENLSPKYKVNWNDYK